MRTNVPHIYAVGDVAGNWQLAHTAFREGEVAAENALGHDVRDRLPLDAALHLHRPRDRGGRPDRGAGARAARRRRRRSGTMPYAAIARAAMYGDRTGFVKVIGESTYGELLGMVVVGTQATELINAGVVGDRGRGHARDASATRSPRTRRSARPSRRPRSSRSAGRSTSRRRRSDDGCGRRATCCRRCGTRPATPSPRATSCSCAPAWCEQVGAGLWTWLPLGWRVKKRVQEIIREEMDRIGGQEMLMPVLHPAEIWKRSGRYDVDVVFKLKDRVRAATSCSRSRTRRSSRCTPRRRSAATATCRRSGTTSRSRSATSRARRAASCARASSR